MNKESEENIMNEAYSKDVFSKKTTYKYSYQDDLHFSKEESLESLKDLINMKVINLDDDCIGEAISYEIQEIRYNCKKEPIREIKENMGKINSDIIYKYVYDERFNIIEKIVCSKYMGIEDDIRIDLYKNIYDENGRLIKVLSKDQDGEIYGTIDYEYDNKRLIRKEEGYLRNYNRTHYYYYNEKDILYEETVFIFNEISCYYQYNTLEDGRIKKTLINPARGKHKWELSYDGEDSKSCQVYMHKPILTVDMIKEIMDYIITNYKGIINCVIIDIYNVNLNYKYDDPDIYKYYYDNYGITILENF